MAGHKLDIFNTLAALDRKDYDYYDKLSDEERKGFSAFVLSKWMASVSASQTMQHYYLASTNYYSNKHLFDINKHPKLQWYCLVASSPGLNKQRHEWLKGKKKETKVNKDIVNKLKEMHPTYKDEDIELLSTMVTKRELTKYAKDSGEK